MYQTIGFLHTSPVHIKTFDDLLATADPNLRVIHQVNEGLLEDARREGLTVEIRDGVTQELTALKASGADRVVCTCSTLGDVAEKLVDEIGLPIMRVDRPMAAKAVAEGNRILVAATLESTLGPTRALLEDEARRQGREVELEMLVCGDAWPYFEAGDQAGYLNSIAQTIQARLSSNRAAADVIVLAQASMAGSRDNIETNLPILSSPVSFLDYANLGL